MRSSRALSRGIKLLCSVTLIATVVGSLPSAAQSSLRSESASAPNLAIREQAGPDRNASLGATAAAELGTPSAETTQTALGPGRSDLHRVAASTDEDTAGSDEASSTSGSPCTMDVYCVRERPTPEVFVSIAAGSRHTCGLLADGRARCWGRETNLYPYTGTASARTSSNFVQIDAQGTNTCGLRASGSIYCWHEERHFPSPQLTHRTERPYEHGTYSAVTTGGSQVCALNNDHRIECWGRYHWEEPDAAEVFAELSTTEFLTIDAGISHICGLRSDRSILCWGSIDVGLLDAPTEKSYVHVAAGIGHTCALDTEGAAVCWGDDSFGQSTPPEAAQFTSLSAGASHTCGLQADGTALCWGSDIDGQVSPPAGVAFAEISAGSDHTCGLAATGEAHCWGSDAYGQSTPPPALARFTRLFTENASHGYEPVLACGLRDDGLAQCWSAGRDAGRDPAEAVHGGTRFKEIAIGDHLACGLLLDGTAACWLYYPQYRNHGRDAVIATVPRELSFETVVIMGNRACGLTSQRLIHCWGTHENRLTKKPYQPPPTGEHISIESSGGHACAINSEGGIGCWSNGNGLPGDLWDLERVLKRLYRGPTSIGEHFSPDETLSGAYRAVALGDGSWYRSGGSERIHYHACALVTTGAAVCWGADDFGQASPPIGVRFSSIAAGGRHTCGVTLEGPTRCWGADDAGQSTPPTREVLTDLRADIDSTCGLRADGDVICWGDHNLSAPAQLVPFESNLPPWHLTDIMGLDLVGVIEGTECSTQRFCTDAPLSRATLAVWLDRLIGAELPAVAQEAETLKQQGEPLGAAKLSRTTVAEDAAALNQWDDVAADVWWAGHARRLVAADVMRPCDSAARTFCPDDPVTRGELELTLHRALRVRDGSGPQARASVAVAHTIAAVGADVLSMCIDRSPERCRQGAMTRGQAATVLSRFRLHLRRLDRPVFTSASGANGGGCGSRSDGSVECWGHDSTGVTHVPSNARVLNVHWDGTLWCGTTVGDGSICSGWDGGYGHTHVAASVWSAQRADTSIGLSHSCSVLADQSIECITASSIGAGPGPILDPAVPEGKFKAVAVGIGYSCALRLDGSPVCWGDDASGETSPPQDARYTALALGSHHSCGLRADGTPECWGHDEDGRLTPPSTAYGVEESDDSTNEQTVERSPLAFKGIAAGNSFTCGLTLDGLLACWGDLERAQPPADVVGQAFTSITAVGNYVCVERSEGSRRCWGSGRFRRSLDNDAGFIEVSANEELTCGRRTDGTVQCWGGEYQDLPSNTPERLSFTSLTTGSSFACGRTEVGTQRCWSLDAERDVPVGAIGEEIVQFSDSGHLLCALGSAGEVTCSDRSDGGETMPRGGDYVQVAAGTVSDYRRGERRHLGQACAVHTSGSIRCWGDNSFGQSTPPAGNDFVKVAASGVHACGLRADGRIECWGQGLTHDEGPSSTQRYSDVVVGAGGGYWGPYEDDEGRITYPAHTCGLRIGGVVDCWGTSYTPNKPYNRHEPDPRSRFTSISSGRGHVCGVRTDGAIECWGIPGFIAY